MIGAPDLWEKGLDGSGIVVAILDSGVDAGHPDLSARWLQGSNGWFNPYAENCRDSADNACSACEGSLLVPCDDIIGAHQGHGTAVAGVLLGGNASGQAIGVAPGAQWIAAKIFRDDDTAEFDSIHLAFQWVLDPDNDPSTDDAIANVVNCSWGFAGVPDYCYNEFEADIEALKASGIAVVFAAGNTGPGVQTSISPGNYASSFAAGSIGSADSLFEVSSFSARGPSACSGETYPQILAPGFRIHTADPVGGGDPGDYTVVSGTSFSAPHVAGAIALLLQAFPDISVAEIEKALKLSADDLGSFGPDDVYGHGLINLGAAVKLLEGVPHLFIHDPSPPENDYKFDAETLAGSGSETKSLHFRNSGGGLLTIGEIDFTGLGEAFSLASDHCSDAILATGDTCEILLRFNPPAHALFPGQITFACNDPDQRQTVLPLTGSINVKPDRPLVVAPANNVADFDTTVTFRWFHPADPDGDVVTDTLLISRTGDFSDSPLAADSRRESGSALATMGAIGCFYLLYGARGKKRWMSALSCLLLLVVAVACSNSGDDNTVGLAGELVEQTVSDLLPETTYYWKVVSQDAVGGTSESRVRSFSTR